MSKADVDRSFQLGMGGSTNPKEGLSVAYNRVATIDSAAGNVANTLTLLGGEYTPIPAFQKPGVVEQYGANLMMTHIEQPQSGV